MVEDEEGHIGESLEALRVEELIFEEGVSEGTQNDGRFGLDDS